MTNATVLLVCHDLVFFPFNGVGGLFEALPQFGISRDQNAYKYEHGCLAFHSLQTPSSLMQQAFQWWEFMLLEIDLFTGCGELARYLYP
jgi:hypothetical protein